MPSDPAPRRAPPDVVALYALHRRSQKSVVRHQGFRPRKVGAVVRQEQNMPRLWGHRTTHRAGGRLVGWWVGSFVSCSRATNGCEVRATSIGAAGTWFGAIGTVAAVLTAVAAFRAGERHKREEDRLALLSDIERENSFAYEASRVSINCHGNHKQGARILGYVVSITNGADQTPIYRLQGRDFTGPLKGAHELGVGQSASTTRHAGSWSAPPEVPVDNQGAFEEWCARNVTIMFKMNGRYWRRTGHRDAELIDSWDAEGPESPPW